MPTVKQYPTPRAFGGEGGPYWTTFHYEGEEFKVLVGPTYEDGGRDRLVQCPFDDDGNPLGVLRWEITYNSLMEEEQAELDEHYQSAVGTAYGFDFWDHRASVLYENVHYEEFKRDRAKSRARGKRKVTLVWEPA